MEVCKVQNLGPTKKVSIVCFCPIWMKYTFQNLACLLIFGWKLNLKIICCETESHPQTHIRSSFCFCCWISHLSISLVTWLNWFCEIYFSLSFFLAYVLAWHQEFSLGQHKPLIDQEWFKSKPPTLFIEYVYGLWATIMVYFGQTFSHELGSSHFSYFWEDTTLEINTDFRLPGVHVILFLN